MTLYLYWGGKLSYLRFLTVVSFKKFNPDWNITVYYPTKPNPVADWTTSEQKELYKGEDYFPRLRKYAELMPLDMTDLGFSNDMTEVHKSDIFRLWILNKEGGLYSDFDILYFKPMPSYKGRLFCRHPDGHYAIGLIGGDKGDEVYKELLEMARTVSPSKYQSLGSTLWAKLEEVPEGWNIPKNLVYACDWQDAESLFTDSKELPKEAIGVHWYGGSGEKVPQDGSTISNLIKEIV